MSAPFLRSPSTEYQSGNGRARGRLPEIAGLLALVGAAACSRAQVVPPEHSKVALAPAVAAPAPSGPPLVHATGLVLDSQPAIYRVSKTDAGFRIEPTDAWRMRSPWSIQLQLANAEPGKTAVDESKRLGDRDARFHVTIDEEAGSGGPLHTLTAWLACGQRRIVLTAAQQVELPAKPDWSVAWTILQTSRCAPKR